MVTREAAYQLITNNPASFCLWWKEILLNHQKVSKHYEHDCRLIQICRILWCYSLFLAQVLSRKSKLSVYAQIRYLVWFEYAEFNGDVYFDWIYLSWFDRKTQSCLFIVRFGSYTNVKYVKFQGSVRFFLF